MAGKVYLRNSGGFKERGPGGKRSPEGPLGGGGCRGSLLKKDEV